MGKKWVFISMLTLAVRLAASQPESFALFTIPKSGSHLLIKALYFMTGFSPKWHTNVPDFDALSNEGKFLYTHCCLPDPLRTHYAASSIKQILGIRDLRDVCVSIVYQIRKGPWPQFDIGSRAHRAFNALSFDEQLLFVINQEYEIQLPKVKLQLGIRRVAQQAVDLYGDHRILICRYEDLVGPLGGGDLARQEGVLKKIAQHLEIPLSSEQISNLATRLYGNQENPFGTEKFQTYQSTFHSGKIGTWKSAFNQEHKRVFKERLGTHLIALGYENDDNW